jgi:hypothetical protein
MYELCELCGAMEGWEVEKNLILAKGPDKNWKERIRGIWIQGIV